MSETKWEAGPYRLRKHRDPTCNALYLDTADGRELAVIYSERGRRSASLLQSAPDLYEALAGLIDALENTWDFGVKVPAALAPLNRAVDVLSLARGEGATDNGKGESRG